VYLRRCGESACAAKLTASDATTGAFFGCPVAVRDDPIVVGARNADPNAAGAIDVFEGSVCD
jgi:hypothetical protein